MVALAMALGALIHKKKLKKKIAWQCVCDSTANPVIYYDFYIRILFFLTRCPLLYR